MHPRLSKFCAHCKYLNFIVFLFFDGESCTFWLNFWSICNPLHWWYSKRLKLTFFDTFGFCLHHCIEFWYAGFMADINTPKPALAPSIQPLVLLERAKLFTALLRALSNIKRAENVLHQAIIYAKRRFYHGPFPQNPEAWLRRASLRILKDYRFANTLAFRDTDPLPIVFAIAHPAITDGSRLVLALDLLLGLESKEANLLAFGKDWRERRERAHRAIEHSLISDVRSFNQRHTERIDEMQRLLFKTFSAINTLPLHQKLLKQIAQSLLQVPYLKHESIGLNVWMDLELIHKVDTKLRFVDRTHWNQKKIAEIEETLNGALLRGGEGPCLLRAQISLCHFKSLSWQQTNWAKLALLYRKLDSLNDSPVTMSYYAEAVGRSQGPMQGLAILEQGKQKFQNNHYWSLVRAELLHQVGRQRESLVCFQRALYLAPKEHQDLVLRCMAECEFLNV